MKRLLVQASARLDLQKATSWYQERNEDVARRFVDELARALGLVQAFPGTGARIPAYSGRARRLPVDSFPYHVVFEVFEDRIEVLAVAHDRKRPGYWVV